MRIYQYPAVFTPSDEGGFVITFPDVPEAITQGETVEQCINEASDALEESIIGRINTRKEVPAPSAQQSGQYLIPVPAQTALKAALYEEVRLREWSNVQLASEIGIDEKEVRRLLNPHHSSKLPRIEEILERVGKRVVIQIEDNKELVARA